MSRGKNNMKTNNKLVAGVMIAGVVALSAVSAGLGYIAAPNPTPQDVIDAQLNASFNAGVDSVEPVQLPGTVQVVEKNVTVEKIVEVDNGNLDKVVDFVSDNVDEDADVEYILFEVDAKVEAEALINNSLINMLDSENEAFDAELDAYRKSEVSVFKIGDAEIVSRDFEDKDLELEYLVKVKAKESGETREYFTYKVTVPFEDGSLVEDDIVIELQ